MFTPRVESDQVIPHPHRDVLPRNAANLDYPQGMISALANAPRQGVADALGTRIAPLRSVELFAGGGGLLLGSSLAQIRHVAAVEWDQWCCDTLRQNIAERNPLVGNLRVIQQDIRSIDWLTEFGSDLDLVMGGPPCQPFSLGGLARGATDHRDMFPALTNAIAALAPRAFVVENVRGLTRSTFADYFELTRLRLQYPEIHARESEEWPDHLARLQRYHTSGSKELSLHYEVATMLVDAADYGVPQRRHRVFIVGFRSDQQANWSAPTPTHSSAALRELQDNGEYWQRHGIRQKDQFPVVTTTGDPTLRPWVTIRDALIGLPKPGDRSVYNHAIRLGARTYPGHTGSPIDSPAKTLKAGDHGVPGGENMIAYPDGSVRYFTVREAARIQTFPDTYRLHGTWTEAMRQLGNAVPVRLAEIVVGSVASCLADASLRDHLSTAFGQKY